MAENDVGGPGKPETTRKSDQEIFDEQIARASGKFIIQLGGLGILAALIISVISVIVATHRRNTTVTVAAAPTITGQATQLKGDALGQQLSVSGPPGGAAAFRRVHTTQPPGR